jgi:dienelactone hydrolase
VEALADAGFVVAAINHPGDNGNDSSRRNALSVWASRPANMVRLLDFMLNDWTGRAAIDPAKIGFFGFSLGGYTGLVLAGANSWHLTSALAQELVWSAPRPNSESPGVALAPSSDRDGYGALQPWVSASAGSKRAAFRDG